LQFLKEVCEEERQLSTKQKNHHSIPLLHLAPSPIDLVFLFLLLVIVIISIVFIIIVIIAEKWKMNYYYVNTS